MKMTLHTPHHPQKLNVSNISPDFDETLNVGSWEHLEQAGTELCQAQLKLASSLFCFRLAELTELELD